MISPVRLVRWPDFKSSITVHRTILDAFFRIVDRVWPADGREANQVASGVVLLDRQGIVLARGGSKSWLVQAAGRGLIPGIRTTPQDLSGFAHRKIKLSDGMPAAEIEVLLEPAGGVGQNLLTAVTTALENELNLLGYDENRDEISFELEKLGAFRDLTMVTEGSQATTMDLVRSTLTFVGTHFRADRALLVFSSAHRELSRKLNASTDDMAGLDIFRRIFRDKLPVMVSQQNDEAEALELLDRLHARAAMAVPIVFEDGICVAAAVVARSAAEIFAERDVEVLSFLGVQIGLALENTQLREQLERRLDDLTTELRLAQRMQQAILPTEPVMAAGVEIGGFSRPARHVGGDFFDYWVAADGTYVGAIGDVMGKGVGAALLMALLRTQVRTCLGWDFGLSTLDHLALAVWDDLSKAGAMATLTLFRLDPDTRCLQLLTAGHHPPLLFHAGHWRLLTGPRGRALGLAKTPPLETSYTEFTLDRGDVVVLCSDGLMEMAYEDRRRVRVEGLLTAVRGLRPMGAQEALDGLNGFLERATNAREPTDDITVLALALPDVWRLMPNGLVSVAPEDWRIPDSAILVASHGIASPQDLPAIRKMVQIRCRKRAYSSHQEFATVLAVNEITTNALRHAGGGQCEIFEHGECLIVSVRSQGGADLDRARVTRVLQQDKTTDDWNGFGLKLASAYAKEVFLAISGNDLGVRLHFVNDA